MVKLMADDAKPHCAHPVFRARFVVVGEGGAPAGSSPAPTLAPAVAPVVGPNWWWGALCVTVVGSPGGAIWGLPVKYGEADQ